MDVHEGRPDFTEEQHEQLLRHGVHEETIAELSFLLPYIAIRVSQKASPSSTRQRLSDVQKLAKALSKKLLAASESERDALALLESQYWRNDAKRYAQQLDAGVQPEPVKRYPIVWHHVLSELSHLIKAANAAIAEVPEGKAGRSNTASPDIVEDIVRTLKNGHYKYHDVLQEKPEYLKPSESETSAFRVVVGICYEAAGGNADPLRAIRNYLGKERQSNADNEVISNF